MSHNHKPPRISVLLPVYNGEAYLSEAIDSILGQTFTDFEILIIDDGSTDSSVEVIKSYDDRRIVLLENGENIGLIRSLNRGIREARGEYLARMDCDDLAMPERLARQLCFMDENPEVGVCGSWLETIGKGAGAVWTPPLAHDEIVATFPFESVIYHPTVFIRKRFFDDHNLCYDERYPHAEDYELWCRSAKLFQFANLGEVLLYYRMHDKSVGERHKATQLSTASRVRIGLLEELGVIATKDEEQIHEDLSLWRVRPDRNFVECAHLWLLKLKEANMRSHVYAESLFTRILALRWHYVCSQITGMGLFAYRQSHRPPFNDILQLKVSERLVLLGKSIVRYGRRGNTE